MGRMSLRVASYRGQTSGSRPLEKVNLIIARPHKGCVRITWDPRKPLVQLPGIAGIYFANIRELPVHRVDSPDSENVEKDKTNHDAKELDEADKPTLNISQRMIKQILLWKIFPMTILLQVSQR